MDDNLPVYFWIFCSTI